MKVRLLTVSSICEKNKQVPALRLSGDWLGKLGFKLGRKYVIHEKPGQITIQLVSPEEVRPCE